MILDIDTEDAYFILDCLRDREENCTDIADGMDDGLYEGDSADLREDAATAARLCAAIEEGLLA